MTNQGFFDILNILRLLKNLYERRTQRVRKGKKMKRAAAVLIVLIVGLLLFASLASAEEKSSIIPPPSPKVSRLERAAERMKSWGKRITTASNPRLSSVGKGLLLSQSSFVTGSKSKVKVVWVRSQTENLILEVNKEGTASIGYTISF